MTAFVRASEWVDSPKLSAGIWIFENESYDVVEYAYVIMTKVATIYAVTYNMRVTNKSATKINKLLVEKNWTTNYDMILWGVDW